MVSASLDSAMHLDAADVGIDGTLNVKHLALGVNGPWNAQEIWSGRDPAEIINFRELKAIWRLLTGPIGHKLVQQGKKKLLLHAGSQVVVRVTNAFVSASRP